MESKKWFNGEYAQRYKRIQRIAADLYDDDSGLPFYTPHDFGHCQRVEKIIYKLIDEEDEKKLSDAEKFYLIIATYLHDLGMIKSIAKDVDKEAVSSNSQIIREHHHKNSEKYIIRKWRSLGLEEYECGFIGKLCRYHRRAEDINDCEETLIVKDEECRLRLLAAYLRLADALDVGITRAPSEPYQVCLAFGIPDDQKFHWIKSRIVDGIMPKPKEHKIYVQFQYPSVQEIEDNEERKFVQRRIAMIMEHVTDDLKDELTGVIPIFAKAGFNNFLEIIPKQANVVLQEGMLNDLRELIDNYDIMMNPSASKIVEMILTSYANKLGYSLSKGSRSIRFETDSFEKSQNKLKDKTGKFLDTIEEKLLESRQYHLGLPELINYCKEINSKLEKGIITTDDAVLKIEEKYFAHIDARETIRRNSKLFFNENFKNKYDGRTITVLLYSYSELVTKALCGLRDFMINKGTDDKDERTIYNSDKEKECSDKIKIIICECQPKTQTGAGDRLFYYDGLQYALYLKKRGFTNIVIVPDIIAGTLMEKQKIDFIFMGSNGVTKKSFMHSAGHTAIVNLAGYYNLKHENKDKINILLITSKEKVDLKYGEPATDVPDKNRAGKGTIKISGITFKDLVEDSQNRDDIWLCKDKQVLKSIRENNIALCNPKDDEIPIERMNYIISDVGSSEITPENCKDIIENLFKGK